MSLPCLATLMPSAPTRTSMPSAFEDVGDRGRDVLVLARDQARRHLDDRDLAAEAAEHLREFEADVAAADDDQMRAAGSRHPSSSCW